MIPTEQDKLPLLENGQSLKCTIGIDLTSCQAETLTSNKQMSVLVTIELGQNTQAFSLFEVTLSSLFSFSPRFQGKMLSPVYIETEVSGQTVDKSKALFPGVKEVLTLDSRESSVSLTNLVNRA